jgi:hypothetical protein
MLHALSKGDQLGDEEKEKIVTKLVAYTGVSKDYWEKANLRVNQPQFSQEVLRNTQEVTGAWIPATKEFRRIFWVSMHFMIRNHLISVLHLLRHL